MTDTAGATGISEVGTVFVPVADQDRALGSYLDELGFEQRADFPYGEGGRWIEVAPHGSAIAIEAAVADPVPARFFLRDPDRNRFLIVQPD